jgi:hypothetical protein
MNKKSIFYTSAAIALTIVIFVIYSSEDSFRLSKKMDVIETRIETVNFFIKDVENDINKGIFITTFRTLLSFNEYITSNGTFIDDIDKRFKEAFLNGTISQKPLTLMQDTTFTDWANRISAQAGYIDILSDFKINDVELYHDSPWSVTVGINISLDIMDKRNTSQWKRERYLSTKIGIINFEDPLYIINSQGRVTNTIIPTNITQFVIDNEADNLMEHTNSSSYIINFMSPSFLMRFEGNLSNSTFGIESLVNLDEFLEQGIAIKDRSAVDYIYFGSQITTNHRINNTPGWFKIDDGHLEIYQVENITIS